MEQAVSPSGKKAPAGLSGTKLKVIAILSMLIDHLADVMLKGEPLMIRPEETINTAAFIDLFYRSAELKREVTIGEIKG